MSLKMFQKCKLFLEFSKIVHFGSKIGVSGPGTHLNRRALKNDSDSTGQWPKWSHERQVFNATLSAICSCSKKNKQGAHKVSFEESFPEQGRHKISLEAVRFFTLFLALFSGSFRNKVVNKA